MLTAYEKSQYPFEECCNDLGLNPQTCFEFGRLEDWEPKQLNDQTTKQPNNQTTKRPNNDSHHSFQLAINVYQDNDGSYKCQVEYNSNKYSDEIIAQLCQTCAKLELKIVFVKYVFPL